MAEIDEWLKQQAAYSSGLLKVGKSPSIHEHFSKVYGDATVDVSNVQ